MAVTAIKSWKSHFQGRWESFEALVTPEQSLLSIVLSRGGITEDEYFSWAGNAYQIPELKTSFFENNFPAPDFLKKFSPPDGLSWNADFFPICEWDGNPIIACLEKPVAAQGSYVLVRPQFLKSTWGQLSAKPPPPPKADHPLNVFLEYFTFASIWQIKDQKKMACSLSNQPIPAALEFTFNVPCLFQIAFTTEKPYHGYIVSNPFHQNFFLKLGFPNPEHCTVLPLQQDGKVTGFCLLIGATKCSDLTTLRWAEQTLAGLNPEILGLKSAVSQPKPAAIQLNKNAS